MSMGPFGGGGFFGNSYMNGPTGPWAGCGCSSFLMIIAGFLLVMAGCARMLNF
jgi:hypothetical protein